MKSFSIISFLGGLICSGLAMGLIYFLVMLLTFDLGGGETLSEVEIMRTALLFFTLLLALIAGNIARARAKSGDKGMAYGIRVMMLMIVIFVTIYHSNNVIISTPFDKAVWNRYEYKPFRMAATLVKKERLLGMTEQQVTELLGDNSHGKLEYNVIGGWTLSVFLRNGRVAWAELRQPFLCV